MVALALAFFGLHLVTVDGWKDCASLPQVPRRLHTLPHKATFSHANQSIVLSEYFMKRHPKAAAFLEAVSKLESSRLKVHT